MKHRTPITADEYKAAVRASWTEAEFTREVIALARANGWLATHFKTIQMRNGKWLTPLQGDPGFLDTVLTRDGKLIIAELKIKGGKLTPAQRLWLEALQKVPGISAVVWTPAEWMVIEAVLTQATRKV